MKILAIGDLHLRENMGYSKIVSDERIAEREAVLDKIVEASTDCDLVVMMGDQLNGRNNHALTLRRLVALLERFGEKPLRIIVGNHCKWSNGTSALDFLKEIKGKDWKVISKIENETFGGKNLVYLPYFTGPEMMDDEHKDWQSASHKLVESLPSGDILFAHHSISETFYNGIATETFEEILLPMDAMLRKFKLTVAGHVHSKGIYADGRVLITGSIFTDSVGETKKSVWKITDDKFEEIELPVRPIYKLENPVAQEVTDLPANSIVKALVTSSTYDIDDLKKQLSVFDGSVVIEQIAKKRDQNIELESMELNIDNLLKAYAKQRGIDQALLFAGYALIQ